MYSIVIPFYSDSKYTKELAISISEGVQTCESFSAALVDVSNITFVDWDQLHKAHAIIFGTPTYMGGVAGPFKMFMDQTGAFWQDKKWHNKIAAGFTTGTSPSGDKLQTLQHLSVFAMQHGMIWVGQDQIGSQYTGDNQQINNVGAWLGMMGQSRQGIIQQDDQETARLFGKRVAQSTLRWNI